MSDYEKYLEQQAQNANLRSRLKIGEQVFLHIDNNILTGEALKISEKSIKLHILRGDKEEIKSFPYSRIAKKGDSIVLVWESWRGSSGRGGYRWERESYPELRIEVEKIPNQACVAEENFLVVNDFYANAYKKKLSEKSSRTSLKK